VSRYAKAAGIVKKVSAHTFRHSYATDLLRNGADIRSVQALLGHSSITTTQIYTHITDKRLAETHKKFHDKGRA
jgi:site-specific recombinase XerD